MRLGSIRPSVAAGLCLSLALSPISSFASEDNASSMFNCTFRSEPEAFLSAQARVQNEVFSKVSRLANVRVAGRASLAAPSDVPRRNFIDDEIFGKLNSSGVASASLTSDEEFVRRIYLDLTGHLPSPDQFRSFVADTSDNKRNDLIDTLLYSPGFTDKWTMWFGDLFQNTIQLSTSGINRQFDGRNAFYSYLRNSVAGQKSINDLAWEVIAASGNNYAADTGMVNFMAGAQTAGGPIQDTYDQMMVKSVTAFLGLSHYDCLACHSGRGHLDQLNLYAKGKTRMDAWGMSAFFSRTRWTVNNGNAAARQYTDPSFGSTDVYDVAAGQYDANVTFGNRPAHCANALPTDPKTGRCAATQSITPIYRDGRKPAANQNWRAAFASMVVSDPLFAINFSNRIWKAFFNMGLIDPVDSIDPDRLDPDNPPPDGWTLQPTHPELLRKLAGSFADSGYNLRELMRTIVQSSAYQLSSRYDGDWKLDYVPLFARHYPRRLDAEEIHDAIAQSTGVFTKYTVQATGFRTSPTAAFDNLPDTFIWAMKMPDTSEPRNNAANASGFMNNFLRGNRDTQFRSQAGSVLQQLSLMNDGFVNNKTRISVSPTLAAIAKMTDSDSIINEMFLTFMARYPSDREHDAASKFLAKANTATLKNSSIEDLAWALINKVDFLYSF